MAQRRSTYSLTRLRRRALEIDMGRLHCGAASRRRAAPLARAPRRPGRAAAPRRQPPRPGAPSLTCCRKLSYDAFLLTAPRAAPTPDSFPAIANPRPAPPRASIGDEPVRSAGRAGDVCFRHGRCTLFMLRTGNNAIVSCWSALAASPARSEDARSRRRASRRERP